MDQKQFEAAVRMFWRVRTGQQKKQIKAGKKDAGSRGAVTGGQTMNAMAELMADIFVDAGFSDESIGRGKRVELPGYFRPTKQWDLVVVHEPDGVKELAAAIEFKSHVGPSFGNNFNNRVEEAIGNARDIQLAFKRGGLGKVKPWLGYLLLLEETPKSTSPVKVNEPYFKIDPAFAEASYKDRYVIFCRRLLEQGLYDAVCFLTSSAKRGSRIHEPVEDLSFANFMAAMRSHAKTLLAKQ